MSPATQIRYQLARRDWFGVTFVTILLFLGLSVAAHVSTYHLTVLGISTLFDDAGAWSGRIAIGIQSVMILVDIFMLNMILRPRAKLKPDPQQSTSAVPNISARLELRTLLNRPLTQRAPKRDSYDRFIRYLSRDRCRLLLPVDFGNLLAGGVQRDLDMLNVEPWVHYETMTQPLIDQMAFPSEFVLGEFVRLYRVDGVLIQKFAISHAAYEPAAQDLAEEKT